MIDRGKGMVMASFGLSDRDTCPGSFAQGEGCPYLGLVLVDAGHQLRQRRAVVPPIYIGGTHACTYSNVKGMKEEGWESPMPTKPGSPLLRARAARHRPQPARQHPVHGRVGHQGAVAQVRVHEPRQGLAEEGGVGLPCLHEWVDGQTGRIWVGYRRLVVGASKGVGQRAMCDPCLPWMCIHTYQ